MPDKSYWFYLEPFVYVSIKGNDLMLYNTLNGKFLIYNDSPRFIEFLFDLKKKENLYTLKVTREFLRDNGLEDFVEDISGHFMGDMIEVSLARKKPFIMPPHFDIQGLGSRRQHNTLKNISKDSIFSINELTIFVNSRCDNNCKVCKTACKQFLWCTKEKNEIELQLTDIKEILYQTKGCPIKKINIIGGDITQYPHFNGLMDLLCSYPFNANYYFHFFHWKNVPLGAIRSRGPQAKIILLVDLSTLTNPGDLTDLMELAPDGLIFLIQRDEEIPILDEVIEDFKTFSISLQPYFNRHNLDFFKANVFSDLESLTESILDLGMINARKSYNTLNYGKMFIRSNKKIYSDLNGIPLGRIGEISMETAVATELSVQGNWIRVRRDAAPCRDCLLNSICPPLSYIENATGINNSCNIWKDHGPLK